MFERGRQHHAVIVSGRIGQYKPEPRERIAEVIARGEDGAPVIGGQPVAYLAASARLK